MAMHSSINTATLKSTFLVSSMAAFLTACGGGGSAASSATTPTTATTPPTTTELSSGSKIDTGIPSVVTNPNISTITSNITQAIFDSLNAKRSQCGFGIMSYHTELEKAAINHANYLGYVSTQNKSTFGSHNETTDSGYIYTGKDNPYYSGYSVSNRIKTDATKGTSAQQVNYDAAIAAENLSLSTLTTVNSTVNDSQTSQTMLSTLLAAPYHMRGLVSPTLTQIGVSYGQFEWQNTNNKDIMSVLELVSALPKDITPGMPTTLLTYPCEGVTGTEYELTDEAPNPIPNRNLQANPIGQPIYIMAPTDKIITNVDATIAINGVSAASLTILTQATDPNALLKEYEAFIIPNGSLNPATTYTVSYTVTYSTSEQVSKSFNFTTKA